MHFILLIFSNLSFKWMDCYIITWYLTVYHTGYCGLLYNESKICIYCIILLILWPRVLFFILFCHFDLSAVYYLFSIWEIIFFSTCLEITILYQMSRAIHSTLNNNYFSTYIRLYIYIQLNLNNLDDIENLSILCHFTYNHSNYHKHSVEIYVAAIL